MEALLIEASGEVTAVAADIPIVPGINPRRALPTRLRGLVLLAQFHDIAADEAQL